MSSSLKESVLSVRLCINLLDAGDRRREEEFLCTRHASNNDSGFANNAITPKVRKSADIPVGVPEYR